MDEKRGDEMTDATTETRASIVADVDEGELSATGIGDAEGQPAGSPGESPLSQADELEQAIQAFLAEMGSGVVSVSRVVNPLLQVWSVARDVDAVVAVPVENLLTVLVGRSITTSKELTETMTEVRAVLAGTGPLATV